MLNSKPSTFSLTTNEADLNVCPTNLGGQPCLPEVRSPFRMCPRLGLTRYGSMTAPVRPECSTIQQRMPISTFPLGLR